MVYAHLRDIINLIVVGIIVAVREGLEVLILLLLLLEKEEHQKGNTNLLKENVIIKQHWRNTDMVISPIQDCRNVEEKKEYRYN